MSTPYIFPEVANCIMHQSCPGVLLRRDSHPSIHLPLSVYLSAIKIPLPGLSKFSFSAKKSSLHKSAIPPKRSAARLVSFENAGCNVSIIIIQM